MPAPDSSASSCRCYGCRPIRRRHGAGSCRGSSTTVSCMRCRARHARRFSFFHPHVTQSSNPLSAMPHGVLIRHKRISPFMPPRKASAHTRFGYRNPVHVGLLGRRNAQLIIPADALRAPLNSGVSGQSFVMHSCGNFRHSKPLKNLHERVPNQVVHRPVFVNPLHCLSFQNSALTRQLTGLLRSRLSQAVGCRALAIALSSFLHASALVLAADGRLQTSFSSIAASSNSGAAAIRRAFSLSTGLPFIVPTVQILRGPVSAVPTERTDG